MRGFGNLGGMSGMGGMMKQAQKAMEQIQNLQEELAAEMVTGSAGGNMVSCVVTGTGQLESVTIDPAVLEMDDKQMLEDLIVSAIRDGQEKAKKMVEERTRQITGGLPIPPGMGF